MSHIVRIETQVRDVTAARAACERLGLPVPTEGTARLYSGEASGLIVQLPDWRYPVVFDTRTGAAKFDNYRGHWGLQVHFDGFLQSDAVEKAKLEARKQGHTATEQQLADGSIKVTVQIGGAE